MKFPKKNISASLINCYYDCPLGFYYTVIKEMWAPEGPALEIGTMLDNMFKNYHKKKDWFLEAKKEYLKGKIIKQTIENFGVAKSLMETYLKDPDTFIKPRFDIKFEVPIINVVTKEELPNVILKGYLDGLDKSRIKELKSTTEPYTQEKVDNAIQATIYSYGMYMVKKELYPVDYVVVGKKIKSVDRFTVEPTLKDFVKLFNIIKTFIQDVEAERFSKNPNHPFWCSCRKLSKI